MKTELVLKLGWAIKEGEQVFLKEKHIFEKSFQIVKEMFHYNRCLPEQVFQSTCNHYFICDIDKALGGPFQDELQNLASIFKDDYIIMGILNPDPVTYYYRKIGYYNWLHIPANAPENYYWDMLTIEPDGTPFDSLLFNSYTMVWASPSKQWAIWGERDYGVAILGLDKRNKLYTNIQENDTWGKMDEDFATLISYNFKDFKLPKDSKEKLFLHYQND